MNGKNYDIKSTISFCFLLYWNFLSVKVKLTLWFSCHFNTLLHHSFLRTMIYFPQCFAYDVFIVQLKFKFDTCSWSYKVWFFSVQVCLPVSFRVQKHITHSTTDALVHSMLVKFTCPVTSHTDISTEGVLALYIIWYNAILLSIFFIILTINYIKWLCIFKQFFFMM